MIGGLSTVGRKVLGESGTQRTIVFSELVDSVGTGLFLTVSTLFFVGQVGLSAAQVGIGLSVAGAAGLFTSVPLGSLGDRFSARNVLIGLHLWRAVGYCAYVLVSSFPAFLVVVTLVTVAARAAAPLTQALVADAVEPDERVRTMARLRSVRNAGFGLGALLATIPLAVDTRVAYDALLVVNGLTYLTAALMLSRVRQRTLDSGQPELTKEPEAAAAARGVLFNRPFLALTALSAVLLLDESILTIGVPLWIASFTEAPKALVGALFVVNTAMVVLLQVRFSDAAKTNAAASRAMRSAGILLACTTLIMALASGLPALAAAAALIVAILVLTVGEMLMSAGSWQLSYALAPSNARSKFLSVFGLASASQKVVGPLVVTSVIIPLGATGWMYLAALFVVVGLAAGTIGRHLPEETDHDDADDRTSQ